MSRGLLIVNADDWGYDEGTTEAIAVVHRAGGLTSTTAMAFMQDTRRAAERARELPELGIGLHLNFVEEYTDPATPAPVRARQRELIEQSRLLRLQRWVYNPFMRDRINRVVADQFQQFVDLYGRLPTHVDGHHHCHLAANVLLSSALPRGTKIRNALSGTHGHNPVIDGLQRLRSGMIERRQLRTTDYFFSIVTAWPGMRGAPPPDQLGLSRSASVEIMVHPVFPSEYAPLQAPEWTQALGELPCGTYAEL